MTKFKMSRKILKVELGLIGWARNDDDACINFSQDEEYLIMGYITTPRN
jgi:hypothetical protein